MDTRKMEKVTTLIIAIITVCLSFFSIWDWEVVGVYTGCDLYGRILYPFFHANLLHATLNAWCLLSIVFIYDIKIWRLLLSYIIAATIPIDTLGNFIDNMTLPTVGLSAMIFVLFGSISFEVLQKWYYQAWMLFYLTIGFFFPNTNAWIHLYCYIAGLVIALMNKPIKSKHYGK